MRRSCTIARNHALVDGNERLAWAGYARLLPLNGRDLDLTVDDAEAVVLRVATGDVDVPGIAAVLDSHLR